MTRTQALVAEFVAAVETGDAEVVSAAASRIREVEPNSAREWFFKGCAAFHEGRQAEAAEAIKRAIAANPVMLRSRWMQDAFPCRLDDLDGNERVHPWFALQAAYRASERGQPERVAQLVEAALPRADGACAYRLYEIGCEMLLREDSLSNPLARQALASFMTRHGTVVLAPWEALYRGCLAWWDRELQRAETLFGTFAGAGLPSSHFSLGAASFRPSLRASDADGLGTLEVLSLPQEGRIPVVFCADAGYFAQFAPLVVGSAHASGFAGNLHFHIVDGTFQPPQHFPGVPDHWLEARVGYSREADPGFGKPYFASVRFIRALELMRTYGSVLVFSDIDCRVATDATGFLGEVSRIEGAFLWKRIDNHMPWRSVTANLFTVSSGDGSRRMLATARSLLLGLFADPRLRSANLWWCDQNALAIALAEHPRYAASTLSLFDLRPRFGELPFDYAPNHRAAKDRFIVEAMRSLEGAA